jgi:NitT/TauT family transport system ATP-binding protein
VIEFAGVTKSFVTKKNDVLTALQDVTFAVREREFVAIVGPSGCGKSTALNIIAGLTTLTSGRALVQGKPPGEVKLDIGYVFQQDSILPWLRVIDNIEVGLKLRKVPPATCRARSLELLRTMNLEDFADAFPAELSGGMRKRVALAATLAYDPHLLLMDEPFGALDAQTRVVLQDELLRIWNAHQRTVLFVTHDIGEAIALADRIIVMTARPAQIKAEYEVGLARPRQAGDARYDPRFDVLHKQISADIESEITRQMLISARI